MHDRPAPPFARATTPVDRTVAPRAFDVPYGDGLYRRRIRLVNLTDTHAAGELEDDFHHFRVDLRHDGSTILAARGRFLRGPWTVCADAPEPLRAIESRPLTTSSTGIGAYTSARANCTHLFDLAGLVVAHATRADAERLYDIEVTDPTGERRSSHATLWRDGTVVLAWRLERGEIVEPEPWPDAPLRRGFIAWAEAHLDADTCEAAIALRRVIDIAIGRGGDLDAVPGPFAVFELMQGKCQAFTPGKVEIGRRNHGSARHFRDHPELLLADMHLRDAAALAE
ncbi:MAG TPA: hypothetical protein VF183_05675 [Acidimicrobiales bacterium]